MRNPLQSGDMATQSARLRAASACCARGSGCARAPNLKSSSSTTRSNDKLMPTRFHTSGKAESRKTFRKVAKSKQALPPPTLRLILSVSHYCTDRPTLVAVLVPMQLEYGSRI
jgi:hypothetical protein